NDVKREDYDRIKDLIRPGTSDYTAKIKYGEDYDNSGSGRFSGRMTAPVCALGGIILQILEARGIYVTAKLASVHGETNPKKFGDVILKAKEDGDSVGGTVKCTVSGNVAGIGGPLFEGVESAVSMRIFGIPGVKGIEFGNGFDSAKKLGSENNDCPYYEGGKIKFKTNNSGGILGGIASGEPIEFNVCLKPTPSIAKKQNTVNVKTKEDAQIEIGGRHDPCIAVRAVPVVRAMTAIAIYELLGEEETIDGLREKLNGIDMRISGEYAERIKTVRKIGKLKKISGKSVYSESREKEVLENVLLKACGDETAERGLKELYSGILSYSKSIQSAGGKKCGLLGRKLGHSISPEIHALLGDYEYGLFETEDPVSFLENKEFDALNVTVPYKKIAAETVNELRGEACLTGVINTVVREDGKLVGYNTDCFGFETLLKTSG
ncbi:MAG: chorismate synthase, partial [Clostridia bacterium]|nr:chorismate synthase [Clostridia bacterium]